MKHVYLIAISFILLNACKTLKKPEIVITESKDVYFTPNKQISFLNPSFRALLDSTFSKSFIVRYSLEPISDLVSEKVQSIDPFVLELENSLVQNHFNVLDRPLFFERKSKKPELSADYIMEIVKLQKTKHYTGIKISNSQHFLIGYFMVVKIIDTETGKIIALINTESTPCVSGCKIKYNQYQIISIENMGKTNSKFIASDDIEYSPLLANELCTNIANYLLNEMYK